MPASFDPIHKVAQVKGIGVKYWHRSRYSKPPHNRPYQIVLSGEGEVATSDGESRRFHPGEVLFCSDITGKGYVNRALTDLTLAFVNRAKS